MGRWGQSRERPRERKFRRTYSLNTPVPQSRDSMGVMAIADVIERQFESGTPHVAYINGTNPNRLLGELQQLRSKYKWARSDEVMKVFTYYRVSDASELLAVIRKLEKADVIYIDDMDRIAWNSESLPPHMANNMMIQAIREARLRSAEVLVDEYPGVVKIAMR